jgi:O-antigen/teichoic acid export membrane protein
MSRTRKIIGATSIGYLHQASTVLVGIWLTPFLLGRVGQHDLGLWLVAGQLLGYLGLVDLGILAILPREVAYASSQPDATSRIAGLVSHTRGIVRWQVAGLVVICLTFLLVMPAQWSALRLPLAVVFVVFVGAYPLRIPSAVLQGLQDLPYLARTQLAGWAAGTLATVLLVIWGWRLPALVTGWSVSLLLPAVAAAWRFRRSFSGAGSISGEAGRGYFTRSVWVSAGQLGQVLMSGSDVLVIGRLLGAAAVVPYSCTAKLVTIFANYPQLLIHSAQPALTELRGSGSKERLITVAQALTQGMLVLSGALVVLVITTNRFFVTWWVGNTQYAGLGLTLALTAMMLLRHWNVATIYTLFCFGYERQLSLVALADGVVTILGTALLVPTFGLVAAPIASVLGAAVVGLPINVRSAAREMGVSVPELLRPCASLAGAIAAVVTLAVFSSFWFDTSHFVSAAASAVLLLGLYAAVMTPFVIFGPLKPYALTALSMMSMRHHRDQPAAA